eukprot:Nk52_evm42s2531 gene=Nk52_evmTU42s2531
MSQQECRLASFLLRESFGEVVEKVGLYLLQNGKATTMKGLLDGTKLKPVLLKEALFTLMHHNLVTFDESKPKEATKYEISLDEVLMRLRFSRFMTQVGEKIGVEARDVVLLFIKEGRMSFGRLMKEIHKLVGDEELKKCASTYQEVFKDMVNDHYLRRVTLYRVGKRKKMPAVGEEPEFALPESVLTYTASCTLKQMSNNGNGGKKRKRKEQMGPPARPSVKTIPEDGVGNEEEQDEDEDEDNQDGEQNEDSDDVLWALNGPRFMVNTRNRLIVDYVSSRIDPIAGDIVMGMLSDSCKEEAGDIERHYTPKITGLVPVRTFSCYEIHKLVGSEDVTMQMVDQYLELMANDQTKLVSRSEGGAGTKFFVNIGLIIDNIQRLSLEAIVEHKHGALCGRIFRLLMKKKMLEQKQIGELAMIPFKETKEKLYRMMVDNCVQVQEISRTPEHAPSRTFYLFNVEVEKLKANICNDLMKILANIKERREKEHMDRNRVLEKIIRGPGTSTNGGSHDLMDVDTDVDAVLTEAEKTKVEQLAAIVNQLDAAEYSVDENLIVLREMFHV